MPHLSRLLGQINSKYQIQIALMKTFIVYLKGIEVGYLKAKNHNDAEKKAFKKYKGDCRTVSVAYTEL